jgi:predicted SAM-dependent methyltransferase
LLNLGSGSNRIAGAFNVDVDPRADAFVDVTRPLPLPNCAFEWIYCEEVIEHVSEDSGFALLLECYRVLVSGGRIRLSTPDLQYFCEETLKTDRLGTEINNLFYSHGHRFIYSKSRIAQALKDAGFIDIIFSRYQDPSTRLGALDTHADRFNHSPLIAIYVEATRP